jgi:regulator of replication initiation timing
MPPHQQYPPRGQGTPDGERSCACFHLTNDQSVMSVDNPEINTVELGAAPQVGDPGTVAIPGEPRHSNNEKDPSSGGGSTAIVIPNTHTDPNVERLRHEHGQLLQTLHDYRRELSTANEQIDHLRRHDKQSRQLQSDTEKQFHSTNDLLKRQIAETVEENVLLKQDNTALRSVIANSKATLSAVHEESHYVGHLDGLNHLIQSSVAKAFKSNSNQNLSEEAGNKVLDILSEIDPHGRKTVETLSHTTIWTLHKTGRKRIGVVRHIIALFLWSSVFNPFAFGLEKSVSDNLRIVEDSLLSGNLWAGRAYSRIGFCTSLEDSASSRPSGGASAREVSRDRKDTIGDTSHRDSPAPPSKTNGHSSYDL